MGDAHKTVNRHRRSNCCACSCVFVFYMIECQQIDKLEFADLYRKGNKLCNIKCWLFVNPFYGVL